MTPDTPSERPEGQEANGPQCAGGVSPPASEPTDKGGTGIPAPEASEAMGKAQGGVRDEELAEQETAETNEPAAADQAQEAADETGEAPTDEEAAAPPALTDTEGKLLARLARELGDDLVESASAHGTLVVRVKPEAWRRAAEITRAALECDFLSFVSGIDWQPAPREGGEVGGESSAPVQPTEMTFGAAGSAGRFQVFAHVGSTSKKWGVVLKTDVDDGPPQQVQSWVPVYPGADWHERECWEMFGFIFDGHPNLRHLYLPSEFEGHPLRKDFPLLARQVKPWPGLVDVEPMPGEEQQEEEAEEQA